MNATPTLLADPEMEATHFGIPVSYYGEDGELVALGHHSKRRALAAFNRHARVGMGFDNVADDRDACAAEWADAISLDRWATFCAPDPASPMGHPDDVWYVVFVPAGTLGALPVTYLDRG